MSGEGALDKLKKVDWRGIYKSASNKVKQYALNLSPLECQVEDATNKETWGPHGSVMADIAEACFDPEGYRQVLGVIARRLQETGENWRMCYKALLLLEFLIKHGPIKIVDDVESSASVLEKLQRFEYKDPNGRDHGQNVRHRAQEISALVGDPNRVREEREKAKQNKAKYTGVSASEMRMGGFGNEGGSSSFGGGGSRRFDPASLARPAAGGPTSTGGARSSPSGHFSASRDTYSGHGGGGSRGGGLGSATWRGASGSGSDYAAAGARISSPPTSPGRGSLGGGVGGSSASRPDPVDATRARIEKLRLEQAAGGGPASPENGVPAKKKLTDVRVNPKIAASLGLKPVVAAPPSSSAARSGTGSAAGAAAPEVDLLGGLDSPQTQPPPAPAAAAASGGWAAFGEPAAAPAAAAVDLLGGLGATLAPAPAAGVSGGFSPSWPSSPGAASKPAAPKSPAAAASFLSKEALPVDMFAELTGLEHKPQPMGHASGLRKPASPLAAIGPPQQLIPSGPMGGFADFTQAPAVATGAAPPPAGKDPFADLLG